MPPALVQVQPEKASGWWCGNARRTENAPRRSNVTVALMAGAATGGIETFVTYPTEYVKTHLQFGSKQYTGMYDCAMQTVRQHGPLGLYRGMSTLLAGAVPKQGVRWGAFEVAANPLRDDAGRLGNTERAMAGFVAGAAEALIAVTPAETVKTAFIEDQRTAQRFRGLGHGVRCLLAEQGLRGIYKGAVATTLKQGTNQAIRFPVQHTALGMISSSAEDRQCPIRNGVAGVAAGVVSVVVTQPFDVVKTRMQSADANGLLPTLGTVWRGGVQCIYAGTVPRMVRVGANVGLTFTIFPHVKKFFQ
eukprot:TRINITY_DN17567_c0_g2_i1.p2 TRINITY_DN17567_c0_g2~~TRINITY_DN17567_c0_g2_i1.p2  ORF type:complete len:304 (+),score=49.91 TRINITY_DN17567_c0_g2_i1:127-1038(+)